MARSRRGTGTKPSLLVLYATLVFFLTISFVPAWAQEEEDPFAMPAAGEVKKQEAPEIPTETESAASSAAPSAVAEPQAPEAIPQAAPEPNAPIAIEPLGTSVAVEGETETATEAKAPAAVAKASEVKPEVKEPETKTPEAIAAKAPEIKSEAKEAEAKPETKPEEKIEVKEPPKAATPAPKAPEITLIDDFNGGVRSNLLGGAMGTWSKDEYDDTQSCEIDFVEHPRLGKAGGYSMQISYDVDSPNPAYNGVWIKLEGFDASPYKFLVLYLKAPNSSPYGTDKVKIELRNTKKQTGQYLITRIPRGAWREYKIPLKKFSGLKDLSSLDELVIVFDDKTSNPKEGILYLENVYFTKGEIRRPE